MSKNTGVQSVVAFTQLNLKSAVEKEKGIQMVAPFMGDVFLHLTALFYVGLITQKKARQMYLPIKE